MGCRSYPIGILLGRLTFDRASFFFFMAAKVCCSIETEPRTLSEGELNHAREVAADVVMKMEPNEASAIFIEGLRPVGSMKEMECMIREEGEEVQLQSRAVMEEWAAEQVEEEAQVFERPPCQCLCPTSTTASVDSPHPDELRLTEPLSAPF